MKTNIKFDLDCCFVDFMAMLEEHLASIGHKIIARSEYAIKCDPPMDKNQLYRIMHDIYSMPKNIPIYPGAKELVGELYSKTLEPIYFVTSRPVSSAHGTYMLIRRFCKSIPYVVVFTNGYPKISYVSDVDYFVEDRRKTIYEMLGEGKTVFVPTHPWNADIVHRRAIRINSIADLAGIVDMFVKK